MAEISSLSTEYVKVPVEVTEAGLPADPTGGSVQLAFTPVGSDDPTTWVTGSWETDATTVPPTYLARVLVGPGVGATALADGRWAVWVKPGGFSPELPVMRAPGELVVS